MDRSVITKNQTPMPDGMQREIRYKNKHGVFFFLVVILKPNQVCTKLQFQEILVLLL